MFLLMYSEYSIVLDPHAIFTIFLFIDCIICLFLPDGFLLFVFDSHC
jgi:hypothetical protein